MGCAQACAQAGIAGMVTGFSESFDAAEKKDSGYIVIRQVIIKGNKKTKESIIRRELGIQPGDTLRRKGVNRLLEERRQYLVNTSLFLSVVITLDPVDSVYQNLNVVVIERWYIFAFPIFSLADRNFNQWWVEQRHRADRVNYGVNFYQTNFRGRRNELVLGLQSGYTRRFVLEYSIPYIDHKLHHGVAINIGYGQNREINYASNLNKQVFYRQEAFVRKFFYAQLKYTYRKAIKTTHSLSVGYHFQNIGDTVARLNPNFFGGGVTSQRYLEFYYKYDYIDVDNRGYPTEGMIVHALFNRKGFGGAVNGTIFGLEAEKYWPLGYKAYLALGMRSRFNLNPDQPYSLQRALGYGEDYLRGLEYYVVDGTRFGLFKVILKRELASFKIHLPLIPDQFNSIPLRIFLKTYGDMGYSYNQNPGNNTVLSNRWLYSGGFGIDIASFYDLRFRFEYSFNQIGGKGLFLHLKSDL